MFVIAPQSSLAATPLLDLVPQSSTGRSSYRQHQSFQQLCRGLARGVDRSRRSARKPPSTLRRPARIPFQKSPRCRVPDRPVPGTRATRQRDMNEGRSARPATTGRISAQVRRVELSMSESIGQASNRPKYAGWVGDMCEERGELYIIAGVLRISLPPLFHLWRLPRLPTGRTDEHRHACRCSPRLPGQTYASEWVDRDYGRHHGINPGRSRRTSTRPVRHLRCRDLGRRADRQPTTIPATDVAAMRLSDYLARRRSGIVRLPP